jgi:hypothetical protein
MRKLNSDETRTFTTGKHSFNPTCICKRCTREAQRRVGQQVMAVRPRRRRTPDIIERYRKLDDAGMFDGPWLNDVDW